MSGKQPNRSQPSKSSTNSSETQNPKNRRSHRSNTQISASEDSKSSQNPQNMPSLTSQNVKNSSSFGAVNSRLPPPEPLIVSPRRAKDLPSPMGKTSGGMKRENPLKESKIFSQLSNLEAQPMGINLSASGMSSNVSQSSTGSKSNRNHLVDMKLQTWMHDVDKPLPLKFNEIRSRIERLSSELVEILFTLGDDITPEQETSIGTKLANLLRHLVNHGPGSTTSSPRTTFNGSNPTHQAAVAKLEPLSLSLVKNIVTLVAMSALNDLSNNLSLHKSDISRWLSGNIIALYGNHDSPTKLDDEEEMLKEDIEKLRFEATRGLPSLNEPLIATLKTFNPVDVRNIFNARDKLLALTKSCTKYYRILDEKLKIYGKENSDIPAIAADDFIRKLNKQVDVKINEVDIKYKTAEQATRHKVEKELKRTNSSDDSTTMRDLNELEKVRERLEKEKHDLLAKVEVIDEQLKANQAKAEKLKNAVTRRSSLSMSSTPDMLEAMRQKERMLVQKTAIKGLETFQNEVAKAKHTIHPVAAHAGIDDQAELRKKITSRRDIEDTSLAAIDEQLNIDHFCFAYLQQKIESLKGSQTELKRRIHFSEEKQGTMSATRNQRMQSELDEVDKTITEETIRKDGLFNDLRHTLETAGSLIEGVVKRAQGDLPQTKLLRIWRIRDTAKQLGLEDKLHVHRFSDVLPENIARTRKVAVKKNKARKEVIKSEVPEKETAPVNVDSKPGQPKEASKNAPPHPPVVPHPVQRKKASPKAKAVAAPAWGAWGKPADPKPTGTKRVKSLVEIQQEEEENLKAPTEEGVVTEVAARKVVGEDETGIVIEDHPAKVVQVSMTTISESELLNQVALTEDDEVLQKNTVVVEESLKISVEEVEATTKPVKSPEAQVAIKPTSAEGMHSGDVKHSSDMLFKGTVKPAEHADSEHDQQLQYYVLNGN